MSNQTGGGGTQSLRKPTWKQLKLNATCRKK